MLGKHYSEFLHPENRARDRTTESSSDSSREKRVDLEFPVTSLDGKTTWLGQKLNVRYNQSGKPEHITGVARDITEIRNIQEQIRKSEEKYGGLIENMELGLLEVDRHDTIVRAYDGFCRDDGL